MADKKRLNYVEINEQIALHFGFKKSDGREYLVNGVHPQWTYPRDFYLSQGGDPNIDLPDFLKILDEYLKLVKKHENGGPRLWA